MVNGDINNGEISIMGAGRIWTLAGIHDSKIVFAGIKFTTTGRYLDASIQTTGEESILWTFDSGASSSNQADPGTQDFGSEATRHHTLVVTPWTAATGFWNFMVSGASEVFTVFTIPDNILTNITFLYLSVGGVSVEDGQITTLNVTGMTSLTQLQLANQNIDTIEGMSSMTSLTVLSVADNNLTSQPNIPVAQRSNVTQLILNENSIANIDLSGFDSSLSTIRFGGSGQPTSFSEDMTPFTFLTSLLINDTGLTTLSLPAACLTNSMQNLIITNNLSLATLTLGAYPRIANWKMYGNNLSAASLDAMIDGIDALAGLWSKTAILTKNNPPSSIKIALAVDINETETGWVLVQPSDNINLAGYTEDDTPGRLTVASNSITVTGLTADDDSYVYTDLGAGNIDGRVWCQFKINVSAAVGTENCILLPFLLSDTLDDYTAIIAADIQAEMVKIEVSSDLAYVRIGYNGTGGSVFSGATELVIGRDYWISICKEDQNGANGRLRGWLSTTDDFSSKSGGGPNWTINFATRADHRYLYACCSNDAGNAGASISCVISDWKVWVE